MRHVLNALAVGGLLLTVVGLSAEPYARHCARNIDLSPACKVAIQTWIWMEGDAARDALQQEVRVAMRSRIDAMLPDHWKN